MIIFNKKYFFSTILIFSFLLLPFYACHKAPGYNPYLHSKPTLKQQRANKKAMDQGAKNYRKQLRKTRRRMFGGSPPPGRPGT